MRRSWPTDASHDSRVWCGRPGDQVHADVAKSGGAQEFRGAIDIFAAMHAARGLKLAVVERLRAEADAVEAGREPRACLLRRDRFGIGFQRDFREF